MKRAELSGIDLPGNYPREWEISSRRLAELGVYEDIARRYPFRGSNVLELGVGPGEETKAIWQQKPNLFLGVDHNWAMLLLARDNLQKEGYSVNLNNPSGIPMFDLKGDSINLALADYYDSSTFDLSLGETFDIALLTFRSAPDPRQMNSIASVSDTIYPLLREGGKFIYADRAFVQNPDSFISRIMAPLGYTLEAAFFEENQNVAEASFWGNKRVFVPMPGALGELTGDKDTKDGEIAKIVCDAYAESGFRVGLFTLELKKNPEI
ncbi:MAG: class I SAM-dependent methyltransferase [Candidatus Aenigmarchaeota archaeon]|nr:class I SAM-dependent methyltransferase [Candidatus Aenigmarchaeota archaeon]